MSNEIDWTKSHCGVHQAPIEVVLKEMPELAPIIKTFPDRAEDFTWDVKVQMLFPNMYPCIPNWHTDNVPRIDGLQRFDLCDTTKPMYLWISGAPRTQFKHGFVEPKKWIRFTQQDEHRGTRCDDFTWRCFIRATHKDIQKPKAGDYLRRHIQVYLDAEGYQW
jgi:hypothetical protein